VRSGGPMAVLGLLERELRGGEVRGATSV